MKCFHKILIIMVFLASTVYLTKIKRISNLEKEKILKIYKRSEFTYVRSAMRKYRPSGSPDWNEIHVGFNEELTKLNMSFEWFMRSADTLYHLIECFSDRRDYWPIDVKTNTMKYRKCPHQNDPEKYDFLRDTKSIMYSCYLRHFKCDVKENELECFFKYLGLNFTKVNLSKFEVTASEIDEETKINGRLINERIKSLILLEQDSKSEVYAILYNDKEIESINKSNSEKMSMENSDQKVSQQKGSQQIGSHQNGSQQIGSHQKFSRLKFSQQKDSHQKDSDLTGYINYKMLDKNFTKLLFEYSKHYSETYTIEIKLLKEILNEEVPRFTSLDFNKNFNDRYVEDVENIFNNIYNRYFKDYDSAFEYNPAFEETNNIKNMLRELLIDFNFIKNNNFDITYLVATKYKKEAESTIKKIKIQFEHLIQGDKQENDKFYLEESYLTKHHKNLWKIELEKI